MLQKQFKQFAMANVAHIYVKTLEYDRAIRQVSKAALEVGYTRVFVYSGVTGLKDLQDDHLHADCNSPSLLMHHIKEQKEKSVYIIRDIHGFYNDPGAMAVLQEIIDYSSRETPVLVTGLSPLPSIPDELLLRSYIIDLPLPSRAEIIRMIDNRTAALGLHLSRGLKKQLANALNGLSEEEVVVLLNRVVTEAFLDGGYINSDSIEIINTQKKQVIQKSGLVEFIDAKVRLEDIGGLDQLKRWLRDRKPIFDDMEHAAKFGLKPPKGILLFGTPGSGKSLTAKVIANYYTLPLLRVDMGLIFGHKSPEEAISRVTLLADTIAPCVLFIDELEKALAGSESGSTDPVSVKMLGILLTWMQERTAPVFIVATANDISMIRPEMYRDGRVDEKFFLGFLDNTEQIKQIIDIHLQMRLKDLTSNVVRPLVYEQIKNKMLQRVEYYGGPKKAGYSGANLEALVVKVLEDRFFRSKEVIDTKDFLRALNILKPQHGFPIAQMLNRAEEIDAITA